MTRHQNAKARQELLNQIAEWSIEDLKALVADKRKGEEKLNRVSLFSILLKNMLLNFAVVGLLSATLGQFTDVISQAPYLPALLALPGGGARNGTQSVIYELIKRRKYLRSNTTNKNIRLFMSMLEGVMLAAVLTSIIYAMAAFIYADRGWFGAGNGGISPMQALFCVFPLALIALIADVCMCFWTYVFFNKKGMPDVIRECYQVSRGIVGVVTTYYLLYLLVSRFVALGWIPSH